MNCEVVQEQIVAAAYGELADHEIHELERHLQSCSACRSEREQVEALRVLARTIPVMEPDANLVARARLRLEESLDALPPRRWFERLVASARRGVAGLRSAPVAALLLLATGVAGGTVGGYRVALWHRAPVVAAAPVKAVVAPVVKAPIAPTIPSPDLSANLSNIAGVSSIRREPNSEIVNVAYNQIVPRQVTGSLDDPSIRHLLMMAAERQASAKLRSTSVGLLAAECRRGHSCQPAGIRDALIVALRYDASPEVREKALAGLEPYVDQDTRVRDAVLEAIMYDTDPQVRSASIAMLTPVEGDMAVRQVLHTVSTSDANPYIRYVSRQMLDQVPEIQ